MKILILMNQPKRRTYVTRLDSKASLPRIRRILDAYQGKEALNRIHKYTHRIYRIPRPIIPMVTKFVDSVVTKDYIADK